MSVDRGNPRHLLAWGAWAATLSMLAAALTLSAVSSFEVLETVGLAIGLGCAASIGAALVIRGAGRRAPWLLVAFGAFASLNLFAEQFAYFAVVHVAGDLGIGKVAIGVANVAIDLGILSLLLLLLTVPDGRLPGPRWRPVVWMLVATGSVWVTSSVLDAASVVDVGAALGPEGFTYSEGHAASGLGAAITDLAGVLGVALAALVAAALVLRFRASRGEQRQALKWVVFGGVVAIALLVLLVPEAPSPLAGSLQHLIPGLATASVAGGFGLAMFRYRLWEVDLVLRRSLVYGVLWLAIAGIYAAMAAALGLLAGARFPVELAIGLTVLVTLGFLPARRAVERAADRWVFGRRDSALDAVRGLEQLMASAERPGEIAASLAATATAAAGLSGAEVELEGSPPVRVGSGNGEPPTAVPVRCREEHLGRLICRPRPGRALAAEDEALLEALASQAGFAISNARLASRIVHAQESERRRIERNIHDGAQQELVALVAELALARAKTNGDRATDRVLARVQRDVQRILADLRELAQGIHPAVLADGGLAAAVEDLCSRLPVEVRLDVAPELRSPRLPGDIESAAYFFVAEALTNALKHSGSGWVEVRLSAVDGRLTVAVRDSGVGFEPRVVRGSGLPGLRDRIVALGGEVRVESRRGAGARLTASLPAAPEPPTPT